MRPLRASLALDVCECVMPPLRACIALDVCECVTRPLRRRRRWRLRRRRRTRRTTRAGLWVSCGDFLRRTAMTAALKRWRRRNSQWPCASVRAASASRQTSTSSARGKKARRSAHAMGSYQYCARGAVLGSLFCGDDSHWECSVP
eukprot:2161275-Pyramimonas_sp.AAC.1